MATTFITLGTTPKAMFLKNQIDLLATAASNLSRAYQMMQTMVDNPTNPTDFTLVETMYGLQSGQGSNFYNVFNNANNLISNQDFVSMITNMG